MKLDLPLEKQKEMVLADGNNLQFINAPEEICLLAVEKTGSALQHVNMAGLPSMVYRDRLCIAAIKSDGCVIGYIEQNLMDKISSECYHECRKLALQQNPLSIQYMSNPTEAEQMAVVEKNPSNFTFIKSMSDSVAIYVIKNIDKSEFSYKSHLFHNNSDAVLAEILIRFQDKQYFVKTLLESRKKVVAATPTRNRSKERASMVVFAGLLLISIWTTVLKYLGYSFLEAHFLFVWVGWCLISLVICIKYKLYRI